MSTDREPAQPPSLLAAPPRVINVGLEMFAADLAGQGADVVQVMWRPPAVGAPHLASLLDKLMSRPQAAPRGQSQRWPLMMIELANREAVRRIFAGEPVLVDVVPAKAAIPALGERMILHAGPPVAWERMCGPMRGAIMGGAVFEGWAKDLDDAARQAEGGSFAFHSNHDFGAVGPMTGITTASQPVMVVENRAYGNRAVCAVNEGLGKVMRFGGNDAQVLGRLAWIRDVLGPALGRAVREAGGIALKPLIARGLNMGDEMHQRNVACSSLLMRTLAAPLARTARNDEELAACFSFLAGNDQFFLNVGMAMGKALTDPANGIAGSSVVTAMSRNGTDFGIRVSATGTRWFAAPVEMPSGIYFPGFSECDANPDMGDSAIMETIGLGAFAMAAAPAVVCYLGAGRASQALAFTHAMVEITVAANPAWTIPAMDFAGVPTGIDIGLVAESGITPTINTGIAHREPGIGQVGAGIVKAPIKCFEQALVAFAETVGLA
jgi:hypothetical protein